MERERKISSQNNAVGKREQNLELQNTILYKTPKIWRDLVLIRPESYPHDLSDGERERVMELNLESEYSLI